MHRGMPPRGAGRSLRASAHALRAMRRGSLRASTAALCRRAGLRFPDGSRSAASRLGELGAASRGGPSRHSDTDFVPRSRSTPCSMSPTSPTRRSRTSRTRAVRPGNIRPASSLRLEVVSSRVVGERHLKLALRGGSHRRISTPSPSEGDSCPAGTRVSGVHARAEPLGRRERSRCLSVSLENHQRKQRLEDFMPGVIGFIDGNTRGVRNIR